MLKFITTQINNIIAEDITIASGLKKLEGTEVAVKFLGFDTGFVVTIASNRVNFAGLEERDYNSIISASLLDFMYIMNNKGKRGFVFPKNAEITGNGEEAMRLLTFLANLNLDWERYLSLYVGDGPSHIATKAIKSGMEIFSSVVKNTGFNTADFLTDEVAMVPTKREVDEFCHKVTLAYEDVSRLEARLNKLMAKDDKCE